MSKYYIIVLVLIIFFMTVTNWGSLQKSAEDSETIEQAINRLIGVHEGDSTSHLGVGESLQAHKNADVIDHPLGSVVGDKMSIQDFLLYPTFESLDRYTYSATTSAFKLGTVDLSTSAVNNNVAYLYAGGASGDTSYDSSKKGTFQFNLTLFQNTSQIIYAGLGGLDDQANAPFVGFKIVNATLYACQQQYGEEAVTEYTTEIAGITVNARHNYRIEVNATTGSFDFYVDGVYKASLEIQTDFDVSLMFFTFYVKTQTTAVRHIRFGQILYSREF